MTIDWVHFTPWRSLIGGILIGGAAGLLLIANGRIAGISGIISGIVNPRQGDKFWRMMFVLGLLLSPLFYSLFFVLPTIQFDTSWPWLMVAGLLVGFGTLLGSGCTSGHGVCGLSRQSPRSLVATITFMALGFITVFVMRHLLAGA